MYPAEDPSSIGKANCEPYIINMERIGTMKSPIIPPKINKYIVVFTWKTNPVTAKLAAIKVPRAAE